MSIFELDHNGLKDLLKRLGDVWPARLLFELAQNGWDEDGVTKLTVVFEWQGRSASVRVEDDAPAGFSDLADAYTVFSPSKKRGDPAKRGFFNFGEKAVIACCRWAKIVSTKGTVEFDVRAGKRTRSRARTQAGTVFEAEMTMLRREYDASFEAVRTLMPPPGILVTINGAELQPRTPLAVIPKAKLPTVFINASGEVRRTRRQCQIEVHRVEPGEVASVYEMGIPICPTGDKFHVNVQQRVPVNLDRTGVVAPGYLQQLRVLVLNATHAALGDDDASSTWTSAAVEDPHVSAAALTKVLDLRFGSKRVAFDPSDTKANRKAVSKGYTVVHGRQLSKAAWANVKREEAIPPAGRITPSSASWEAEDAPSWPADQTTDDMRRVCRYASLVGEALLGVGVRVELVDHRRGGYRASYGAGGHLTLNVARLGHAWFEQPTPGIEVNLLLIHEFAHEYEKDHLSSEYHDACCRLGAKLAQIALEDPGKLLALG